MRWVISQETAELIKVIGIIGSLMFAGVGLLLNAFATFRSVTSRRLLNYQELVKSHRDLWKLTLDRPDAYSRILDRAPNLSSTPPSYIERRFVNLLLLHMTTAYAFSKRDDIVKIEKLKQDFDEVLALPIPRLVWQASRKYFNREFVQFIEREPRSNGIFQLRRVRARKRLIHQKTWNVLVLTAFKPQIIDSVARFGDRLVFPADPAMQITTQYVRDNSIDLILCFGYNRILTRDVLDFVTAINIHPGYLPDNRGPNPHLWSVLERAPRGTTIHYIDEGIDTGDIIARVALPPPPPEATFQQSFDSLITESSEFFATTWPLIRAGTNDRIPQEGAGRTFTLRDQNGLSPLWSPDGLQLTIPTFRLRALEMLEKVGKEQSPMLAADETTETASAFDSE